MVKKQKNCKRNQSSSGGSRSDINKNESENNNNNHKPLISILRKPSAPESSNKMAAEIHRRSFLLNELNNNNGASSMETLDRKIDNGVNLYVNQMIVNNKTQLNNNNPGRLSRQDLNDFERLLLAQSQENGVLINPQQQKSRRSASRGKEETTKIDPSILATPMERRKNVTKSGQNQTGLGRRSATQIELSRKARNKQKQEDDVFNIYGESKQRWKSQENILHKKTDFTKTNNKSRFSELITPSTPGISRYGHRSLQVPLNDLGSEIGIGRPDFEDEDDELENKSVNFDISAPSVVEGVTLRKGLLWQQRDRLFSRWKERFFVLTQDYLQCFKKGSSRISEMGGFIFKIKLSEIEDIELVDRKGYLTICITVSKEGKILLRRPEGIRDWHNDLKSCSMESRKRLMKSTEEFWSKKKFSSSSSNGQNGSGGNNEAKDQNQQELDNWLLRRQRIGFPTTFQMVPQQPQSGFFPQVMNHHYQQQQQQQQQPTSMLMPNNNNFPFRQQPHHQPQQYQQFPTQDFMSLPYHQQPQPQIHQQNLPSKSPFVQRTQKNRRPRSATRSTTSTKDENRKNRNSVHPEENPEDQIEKDSIASWTRSRPNSRARSAPNGNRSRPTSTLIDQSPVLSSGYHSPLSNDENNANNFGNKTIPRQTTKSSRLHHQDSGNDSMNTGTSTGGSTNSGHFERSRGQSSPPPSNNNGSNPVLRQKSTLADFSRPNPINLAGGIFGGKDSKELGRSPQPKGKRQARDKTPVKSKGNFSGEKKVSSQMSLNSAKLATVNQENLIHGSTRV